MALDAGVDLTHAEAKKNFRFLKGCPFKYADSNPELVKNGRIVYIKDSHGIIYPYICPETIKNVAVDCGYTGKEIVRTVDDDRTLLEEIDELPTYLVHELLSKYKNKPSFYRLIKKELICRGEYRKKKYKLRKEIREIELEEGEYNDKYQRRRKVKCKKS